MISKVYWCVAEGSRSLLAPLWPLKCVWYLPVTQGFLYCVLRRTCQVKPASCLHVYIGKVMQSLVSFQP